MGGGTINRPKNDTLPFSAHNLMKSTIVIKFGATGMFDANE